MAEILVECTETRQLAPLIASVGESNAQLRVILDGEEQEREQMQKAQAQKLGALSKLKDHILQQASLQKAARMKIRQQVVRIFG